jgi:hypothetical protein
MNTQIDFEQIDYKLPMSEEFIRNNLTKLDMAVVCEYQFLSEEFIKEFQYKKIGHNEVISFYQLLVNKHLSKYSEEMQFLILQKIYQEIDDDYEYFTSFFTPYMWKQYTTNFVTNNPFNQC